MPFEFKETALAGVLVVQPLLFGDSRGFFMETYKKSDFICAGIREEFCQDNHSFSSKGVLRGIHYQSKPFAQGKLVRVIKGAVWDVAVDLIEGSSNYGQSFGMELNEENNTMLYIPPGFGHGFMTLVDNSHFLYKCTAEYSPESDGGIIWNDRELAIAWPLGDIEEPLVSERDRTLARFRDLK